MSLHRKRARNPSTALCIPQRLYLVLRLSVWLLPCMLVLLPQSSLADTIIFNDLTDVLSVSVTDPNREIVFLSESFERADVIVLAPNNATLLNRGLFEIAFIEPNVPAPDPFNVPTSDSMLIESVTSQSGISFVSDPDAPFVSECAVITCEVETGEIQTVTELLWSDGTVDTIQFQSDVNEIPEPSTVLLLATVAGLTMFVGRRRRRMHRAPPLGSPRSVRRMR